MAHKILNISLILLITVLFEFWSQFYEFSKPDRDKDKQLNIIPAFKTFP